MSSRSKGIKNKVVLVCIMFVHLLLERVFEDIVDKLDLDIALRVIRRVILAFKFQHGGELYPNNFLKVRIMV